jgi:hypothetical protein
MSFAVALVGLAAMAGLALALVARKRRVAVLVAGLGVALVVILGAVRPTFIGEYRVIDDYNLELQVLGAAPIWRGVTQHAETASTVTLGLSEVRSIQFGAGFGDESIGIVVIRLDRPLGERPVIDASTGAAIPRIRK